MARILPIGDPVDDSERRAIHYLSEHLPDTYWVIHNFEVPAPDHGWHEVDIAILAPHGVFLVDVKGTRGQIEVVGSQWYPENRAPFLSPLPKLRGNAKALRGQVLKQHPGRPEIEKIWFDAVVLLTGQNVKLIDPAGRDSPVAIPLAGCEKLFMDASRVPPRKEPNIGRLHGQIIKALEGVLRQPTGPLRLGNWEVEEKLGASSRYTEYRGHNVLVGPSAGKVLLRIYKANAYLPEAERQLERKRIANAYRALDRMPGHPHIARAKDFFTTEHEESYVLVSEDIPGRALRLHLQKPELVLTWDQKLQLAQDLLSALAHAHSHEVIHRHLTPDTLLVGLDQHLHLIGFDFARSSGEQSYTVSDELAEIVDPLYLAPEMQHDPGAATSASDIFCAGLILYELFTGKQPFTNASEVFDCSGVFPQAPSTHRPELPASLDAWLQSLCAFEPQERITAAKALTELETVLRHAAKSSIPAIDLKPPATLPAEPVLDYENLPNGTVLNKRYLIENHMDPGGYGEVYKVIDTWGDVTRALKLILKDPHSTLERLKKEYRTLTHLPEHPVVVRVREAGQLPGEDAPCYLVLEYVEGEPLNRLLDQHAFHPEDALLMARQAAEGLAHLHTNHVYHCDIKPNNLMWTAHGVKIIDFNVSVHTDLSDDFGGGTRRYLPPDVEFHDEPSEAERIDRDLYALGITFYESVTPMRRYPWPTAQPPKDVPPKSLLDLRSDLSPAVNELVVRWLDPDRSCRFGSAQELLQALQRIPKALQAPSVSSGEIVLPVRPALSGPETIPPNTNPFVKYLLTLYSQSPLTNAGTRGRDPEHFNLYIPTALDKELSPAILEGQFKLVLLSGNAGDGKTAYLQALEKLAQDEGAILREPLANGRSWTLRGKTYQSNYDGSQDEGEQRNPEVLRTFLQDYAGSDSSTWPQDQIRLLAINEGRLVDFLTVHGDTFPALKKLIKSSQQSQKAESGVLVINLNSRCVVSAEDPIFDSLLNSLTRQSLWEPCQQCDLRTRCYVHHNAQTFQAAQSSSLVIERLKTLYTLTHLRGRLHITLRDLRSAMAFMLAGTRDCAEIHQLYEHGSAQEILTGFYFNSWMGGGKNSADRLLTLLTEMDVGQVALPQLDRSLGLSEPETDHLLLRFEERGQYDQDLLRAWFRQLERRPEAVLTPDVATKHRDYLAQLRRRSFFERRDDGWFEQIAYRSSSQLLKLITGEQRLDGVLSELVTALNRSEGIWRDDQIEGHFALQIRRVEDGTLRAYRLFETDRLQLCLQPVPTSKYLETLPTGLLLIYTSPSGQKIELAIELDTFEMMQRLNHGYRPSIEEARGAFLNLEVFKHLLGSVPYQQLLLTPDGYRFYQIQRTSDGILEMETR